MKNYDSLADVLDDLRKQGYEADFATQTFCLYCGDLDLRFNPDEFHIDGVYRFGGGCSPNDDSIVYAISTPEGVRGTLVDSYGVYSENLSFEMARKLLAHYGVTQP